MGEIYNMEKAIITAKDIAKKEGVNIATIRHRWNAAFAKGTFNQNATLSPEQVAAISRNFSQAIAKPIKQKPIVNKPVPAAKSEPPARQKIKWPAFPEIRTAAINILLFGAVIAHAGLIWFDCSELWGIAGQIGGGAVFMVLLAALLLASDSSLPRTSGNAMAFVFFVDCAAWKVHYEVFKTPLVDNVITGALCAFICASSFVALWVFRDSKLD